MDAHKALITDIFNNSTLVEVPFFQRSYVWKEDLWSRLLEDMEYVANTCVNFAKSPSVASCYACCYKIVNSFPLIGIFAHFECTNICSNF